MPYSNLPKPYSDASMDVVVNGAVQRRQISHVQVHSAGLLDRPPSVLQPELSRNEIAVHTLSGVTHVVKVSD